MTQSKADARATVGNGIVRPAWLSPAEAAIYLGIGLNHFYAVVMDKVDVRKIGRRTSVSIVSLDRYMESLPKIGKPGYRPRGGVTARRVGNLPPPPKRRKAPRPATRAN